MKEGEMAETSERLVHLAEFAWIVAWLALGALVLAGLNSAHTLSSGTEVNTWQLVFGFLWH